MKKKVLKNAHAHEGKSVHKGLKNEWRCHRVISKYPLENSNIFKAKKSGVIFPSY